MSLVLFHCACAVRRLVTDSATPNRLREKIARDTQDLDRREQSNRWTCGYTGHVPRLRDTFAVGNVVAAKTIRPKEEDPWSFDGDDPGGLHARMHTQRHTGAPTIWSRAPLWGIQLSVVRYTVCALPRSHWHAENYTPLI